jgi:hypothetical protein
MQKIRLDTLRALHERNHKLAAYCPNCQRWVELDLPRLIEEGRGDFRFVGRKPRCNDCGSHGEWQLRSPMFAIYGRCLVRLTTA